MWKGSAKAQEETLLPEICRAPMYRNWRVFISKIKLLQHKELLRSKEIAITQMPRLVSMAKAKKGVNLIFDAGLSDIKKNLKGNPYF